MSDTITQPRRGSNGIEPLWTLDDVAEYVGLSKAALYNLRHLGRGPVGYRVGRHLRFRLADVEAWLEATRDQPSVVA
ncbi:MAG: hypothetical protein QOI06_494 [Nocardioidaceae bacterium]|nr:hypothetical protein [Nocardioidaceae bacterium]